MRDLRSRYRVLFDTNILLDLIEPTRPQSSEARKAMRECNGGGDIGFVTAGSLKDVQYILRKAYKEPQIRRLVQGLLDLLVVLPLDSEACLEAAASDEPDFEDGLVRAAAELNGIDFILTRDAKAFRCSKIKAIDCKEYLHIVASADARLKRKFLEAGR